jgi:hypothetical protein
VNLRAVIRRFIAMVLLSGALFAVAQTVVEVRRAQVEFLDDGVYLVAAVGFELPKSLEEALQRGSALFFVVDATLRRNRWYWRDEKISEAQRIVRVEYVPLLRRYQVSTGGLSQNVDTLTEAIQIAQRGIRLKLAERGQLAQDERYRVEFSYRLDANRLLRLYQIGSGTQRDMQLEVERRVLFTVPEPEKATEKAADK